MFDPNQIKQNSNYQELLQQNAPNFFILNENEAKELWDFLKYQHLPYAKPRLAEIVRNLGDFVDTPKNEK